MVSCVYMYHLRGNLYFLMSNYQKEASLKVELAEKSIQYWNLMKTKWFSKEQLNNFLSTNTGLLLQIYNDVLIGNSENYETIIAIKCNAIMDRDRAAVKSEIGEINILRKELIQHTHAFSHFAKICPIYFDERLIGKLYSRVAKEFRRIILDNQQSQLNNLQMSRKYIKKCVLDIHGEDENVDLMEEKIDELASLIDSDPFIQKFRFN